MTSIALDRATAYNKTVASNARLIRKFIIMKNKRLIIIVLVSVILLLIPLIAMQFTDEVNWAPFDFVVAAILLLSTGFAFDFVIRKVKNTKYRIALSLTIFAILLFIWAELAVGILGTPLSGH